MAPFFFFFFVGGNFLSLLVSSSIYFLFHFRCVCVCVYISTLLQKLNVGPRILYEMKLMMMSSNKSALTWLATYKD